MNSKYLDPLRILIAVGRRSEALRAKRAKAKRFADMKAHLKSIAGPFCVNVGCGKQPFFGWTNLDLNLDSAADFIWDITDGLPFHDDSCSFIYSEHFLEHLPVQDGVRFLAECYRSLKRGGVARIAMPSAQELLRHYHENNWAAQPWLEKYGYAWIKTRAEYINICFREWEHRWLYDYEELCRRLQEAGFTLLESATVGESRHPELRDRETRIESLLICEATK
jgi:predicted SAM-dependent methyltransferase